MIKEKDFVLGGIALILISFIGFFMFPKKHIEQTKPKIITKTVTKVVYKYKEPHGVVVQITEDDLKNAIATHKFLSKNQQQKFFDAIMRNSKKYSISPLVLYSLIQIESSFRFWIESPRRLVVGSNGKKHYDRALGACSVINSIWGDKLKKNHILQTKTELYEIGKNIDAGSFILYTLIQRNKGNTIAGLKAYFGKSNYAKIYAKKIVNEIGKIVMPKILKEK